MSQPNISIRQAKAALDTPALLVDLDVMEANIARITEVCRVHKVNWRPHMKGTRRRRSCRSGSRRARSAWPAQGAD